ncbi:hypothetical protein [Chryseobacterium herbae]|uniref:Uncharacterized protein n=1 Tax=Chryseobacterium herbae TaxID=2976476 RepID=A0ABT2IVH5_9FLAO|nr:hypothetical protein [Chryseobacterium sp. pc1-10]MCT2562844.1 hypothetical protein [Chryseobacterium sp. pc1-10]
MKKLGFLFIILFPLLFKAQIRLTNIYDLYNIKVDQVGSYVLNGLGFKNIGYNRSESSEDFEFYNGKNIFAEVIYIKVQVPFIGNYKNIVTVRYSNEDYVRDLKSEAITSGFEYVGKREFTKEKYIHMYIKHNIILSITETKNSNGLYEIIMIPKTE